MDYLDKTNIGVEVIFNRKYVLNKACYDYASTLQQKGMLLSRVNRFVDDNSIPEYADIIESEDGLVYVKPDDYKFLDTI